MPRWGLNLIGAACLATPGVLMLLGVGNALGTAGGPSSVSVASNWLNLSIAAGTYLIYWCPVLIGGLIIYFANRRRG